MSGGSSRDSTASVSWNLDRIPPDTKIVDEVLDGTSTATFNFVGSDDGSHIEEMQCLIDDRDWEICDLKIQYTVNSFILIF